MATFNCSLCKQECPYIQGNVFTTSDRKFCADCYRILAEKQKERQAAAQAAAAQPAASAQPSASPRNPPAGWSTQQQNPSVASNTAPPEHSSSPRNDQTQRAGFPPRQQTTGTAARAPPAWANTNKRADDQPSPFSSNKTETSQYNSNTPTPTSPFNSNRPEPSQYNPPAASSPYNSNTPAAGTTDGDEDEVDANGKKLRLFDKLKPQETIIFARTHEKKLQEQNKAQEAKKPYTGGPYICSGCNTRQNGLAAACTLCGTLRPEIMRKQTVTTKQKKEIDPDDPFGHIELLSWDEAGPQLKKW